MKQTQDDITTMFEATNDILDQNSTLWSGIPAFADAVNRAKAGTAIIRERQDEQAPTGDTRTKAAVRADLEHQALVIADQLAALAAKTSNFDLAAQVDVTKSGLDRLADSELLSTTRRIAAAATANAAVLASDYGIISRELSALGTAISTFDGHKTAPRDATVERKVATMALPEAIAFVRGIYRNEIDKLLTRFKTTAPDFFGAYHGARVIINRTGSHASPAKPTPTPPPGK